jgi:hypothetical protein
MNKPLKKFLRGAALLITLVIFYIFLRFGVCEIPKTGYFNAGIQIDPQEHCSEDHEIAMRV